MRRFEPYHITCIDSRWYVIGRDQDRNDLRMFLLGRMSSMHTTEERFVRPADFDAEEYLRGRFVAMKGNGDHQVVLEFDRWSTGIFRGRQWHASQRLEDLPEGASRMHLRLSSLEEVARWVLSWDSHVKVVQPPELIELVVAGAKRMRRAESPEPTA